MACVLLGWELGGGLGHVGNLLPIARGLAACGHRPVFAVKELQGALPMLKGQGFAVLQAPLWFARSQPGGQAFRAASIADILAMRGFAQADELEAQVEAWQHLLALTGAELVVSDYSPTLNLAAYQSVPVVVVGTGLAVPPPELPWFSILDPSAVPVMPQERLLANVHEVQRRRAKPIPERLPELFAGAGVFFGSYPELDPYGGVRRQACAIGPLQPTGKFEQPPAERRVFVYLSAEFAGADKILPALAEAGIGGTAYLRDCSAEQRARYQTRGFDLPSSPLPLEQALAGVRVVIHHAGAGMATSALAMGRPQVCLPRHLDQDLTAGLVQALGAGVNLQGEVSLATFTESVRQVMTEPRFGRRAEEIANDIQRRGPWPGLTRIVERCRELLG